MFFSNDRKATVTEITLYKHGKQKSTSERSTCHTLRQMDNKSKRPDLVPIRKLILLWPWVLNWTKLKTVYPHVQLGNVM